MKKTLVSAVVVLAGLAHSAWAGGQQVTVQAGADGRSVVVRTYRCGTPASFKLHGAAEGVVNGARRTVPLSIRAAVEPGVFDVARQWPVEGRWVLVFDVDGERPVSALVELEPGAGVRIAAQRSTYEKPTAESIRVALASAPGDGTPR
jgi:hypothetical protein